MNQYQKENNELFKSFIDFYHYKTWKKEVRLSDKKITYPTGLELYIKKACNLECKYCYLANFGDELYPTALEKGTLVLDNLRMLLAYLKEQDLFPHSLDIFAGEFFSYSDYPEMLTEIYNYVSYAHSIGIKVATIMPTNATWVMSDLKLEDIYKWKAKFDKVGGLFFSFSVDGLAVDNVVRPFRNGSQYTEDFYERLFKVARDLGAGFHPMVDHLSISKWKENFEWWLDNVSRIDGTGKKEALKRIYLLEVRNPVWTEAELKDFKEFMRYIIFRAFELYDYNLSEFFEEFIKGRLLNITGGVIASHGRGIGCSMQSNLHIRLGDLAIVNCHRTSYDGYNGGYYEIKDGCLTGEIKVENPILYISTKKFNTKNTPACMDCSISQLCGEYCIGANFEINKDFFLPIEKVCQLEYLKVFSIISAYKEIGLIPFLLEGDILMAEKKEQILQILNVLDSKGENEL